MSSQKSWDDLELPTIGISLYVFGPGGICTDLEHVLDKTCSRQLNKPVIQIDNPDGKHHEHMYVFSNRETKTDNVKAPLREFLGDMLERRKSIAEFIQNRGLSPVFEVTIAQLDERTPEIIFPASFVEFCAAIGAAIAVDLVDLN